jgi:glycosyltransferase involved in cell wall biosynthesis
MGSGRPEKGPRLPEKPWDNRKVVVSNGCHRIHLFQTALAYQQAGRLGCLIAGWYLKNRALIAWLQSPGCTRVFGASLAKRLLARRQDGLEPERVVSLVIPDLIERVGRSRIERLFPPGWFSYWSMRAFGRLSQRYVENAALFHVRSGYGRGAMARAKDRGAVCLVDHSIADPIFIAEILRAEAARWNFPYEFPHWHWRCVSQDIDAADHLLVNSQFVRDTLMACRGLAASRITVLPLPVNLERFAPAGGSRAPDKPCRILFAGEIGLRKGVLYLLEAFRRLRLKNVELILIGGISDIGDLLSRSGVAFRHIPVMPLDDLIHYYQQASMFVFPSLVEGAARVVQEAMACGVPVITTPHAGSVIQDGVDGFIVPIRDVDALCECILELYHHPDRRAAMGKEARRTAEREFAPRRYDDGLLGLYQELCHPR